MKLINTIETNWGPIETVQFMKMFCLEELLKASVEALKKINLFSTLSEGEAETVFNEFWFVHGEATRRGSLAWWLQDSETYEVAKSAFDRTFFNGPVEDLTFVAVKEDNRTVGYTLSLVRKVS